MSVKTTLKEFVSILDKAWEGKRAAQMVQFVLYLDLAMILAGLMGLAEWDSRNTPSRMGCFTSRSKSTYFTKY